MEECGDTVGVAVIITPDAEGELLLMVVGAWGRLGEITRKGGRGGGGGGDCADRENDDLGVWGTGEVLPDCMECKRGLSRTFMFLGCLVDCFLFFLITLAVLMLPVFERRDVLLLLCLSVSNFRCIMPPLCKLLNNRES